MIKKDHKDEDCAKLLESDRLYADSSRVDLGGITVNLGGHEKASSCLILF